MLDVVLASFIMMVSATFFGFGAVAAALAGPHRLVCVAMMLMMIAASQRPALSEGERSEPESKGRARRPGPFDSAASRPRSG
jgi:hypothetical protein